MSGYGWYGIRANMSKLLRPRDESIIDHNSNCDSGKFLDIRYHGVDCIAIWDHILLNIDKSLEVTKDRPPLVKYSRRDRRSNKGMANPADLVSNRV